jgi:hypothetical protein
VEFVLGKGYDYEVGNTSQTEHYAQFSYMKVVAPTAPRYLPGFYGVGTGIEPHAQSSLLTKLFSLSGLQDVLWFVRSACLQSAATPAHLID